MPITCLQGSRREIKEAILARCFIEQRQVWLIDSLQVFDPYRLARNGAEQARKVLGRMRVCRPFTSPQLKMAIRSLQYCIAPRDLVIVSGIGCFDEDLPEWMQESLNKEIISMLKALLCEVIIGGGTWEEQSFQHATRSKQGSMSLNDSSRRFAKRTAPTLNEFEQQYITVLEQ